MALLKSRKKVEVNPPPSSDEDRQSIVDALKARIDSKRSTVVDDELSDVDKYLPHVSEEQKQRVKNLIRTLRGEEVEGFEKEDEEDEDPTQFRFESRYSIDELDDNIGYHHDVDTSPSSTREALGVKIDMNGSDSTGNIHSWLYVDREEELIMVSEKVGNRHHELLIPLCAKSHESIDSLILLLTEIKNGRI